MWAQCVGVTFGVLAACGVAGCACASVEHSGRSGERGRDNHRAAENAATDRVLEFVARVEKVKAIPGETPSRKRWDVELLVTQVVVGRSDADVDVGSRVHLLVHSVVKSFGPETEDITGREYQFRYLDPFALTYEGKVTISREATNRAPLHPRSRVDDRWRAGS